MYIANQLNRIYTPGFIDRLGLTDNHASSEFHLDKRGKISKIGITGSVNA